MTQAGAEQLGQAEQVLIAGHDDPFSGELDTYFQ